MAAATSGVLERRLQSRPITNPVYRATMNLQVVAAQFEEDLGAALASDAISPTGMNVLRILKGEPEGHPRWEIARRLMHRNTDVTRIIDRLTRRGLVERVRSPHDRRLSLTRLTPKGHKLVARLDRRLDTVMGEYARKLSNAEFQELNRLLEALYRERIP